jgi:predicted enzyme related to lactoylglutathione lyase
MTDNVDGALDFYAKLFGWTYEESNMGPAGTYTLFKKGDQFAGGCMALPQEGIPPHWMSYVAVDDVDASTKKAEGFGAKVLVPPTDIPKAGRFSVITDPSGASLGLFKGTASC